MDLVFKLCLNRLTVTSNSPERNETSDSILCHAFGFAAEPFPLLSVVLKFAFAV